jgi:hypothetical protein
VRLVINGLVLAGLITEVLLRNGRACGTRRAVRTLVAALQSPHRNVAKPGASDFRPGRLCDQG